jgi:PPP family 3-phenylpropionic acid transporter
MRDSKTIIQGELKAQYALYYGLLGAVIPFWSLFLYAREFTAHQVGVLVSMFGASRILCPTFWGVLADRAALRSGKGHQEKIYSLCIFMALFAFSPMMFSWSYGWMAVWVLLYGACWSGIAPLLETRCVKALSGEMNQYGGIRLWGSVGFLVMVILAGQLFDWVAIEISLPLLLLGGMLCLLLLALLAVRRAIRDCPKELSSVGQHNRILSKSTFDPNSKRDNLRWLELLKQPKVWVFLGIVCLVSLSHGPFYTFLSVYLDELGYNRASIGVFWGISVVAEILAFNWLRTRSTAPSTNRLLTIAICAAVLRWGLMIFVPIHWLILVCAQLLHAATFGAMHVASIARVHELFKGPHHAKGQGLYSSLGLATGASLGALWSGFSWSWLGSTMTFVVALLLALAALLLLMCSQWSFFKTVSPSRNEYENSHGN